MEEYMYLVIILGDFFLFLHENIRWVQLHSFVEIDHELFSAVILSLSLIQ